MSTEKVIGESRIERPFFFAKRSTIGVGGKAKAAYYPQTEDDLCRLVARLQAENAFFVVLGNLSNVLPPDGDSDCIVVRTTDMRGVYRTQDGVYAEVGVNANALIRACQSFGLGGAEFMTGIPCTLGGALYMNAGVSGEYIDSIVKNVVVLYRGKKETLSVSECRYGYKSSVFMREPCVIVGATIALTPSTQEQIEERLTFFSQRRAHLPTGKSMGCVFKNPNGSSAGRLIEGTGLKGLRIGGAKISESHANFIVNDERATAANIKDLITVMKNAVFAQYKIRLEEEICYLPQYKI